VLGWFAFKGATDNQFVNWDDPVYVSENPFLTTPTPENAARIWDAVVSNNYHPVTMWSLLQNVKSGGLEAGPIIRTNILIHLLNSALLLWFVGALTRGRWLVAGFTALLFAVHPMHVESVVWVSERKDVLYVLFGMGSLIAYLYYIRRSSYALLALALGLFALACLSKAMAVIFPLLFMLVDYWENRKWTALGIWLEKIPFFALSLLFGLIAMDVQRGGNFHGWFDNIEVRDAMRSNSTFGFFDKFKFAGYGLFQYCLKLFAPFGLCTYYPYPPKGTTNALPYLGGALFLPLYLGATAWAWLRGRKALAFGLAWCFISVALVLQFVTVGRIVMADRYTYLPYAGLFFVLLYEADRFAAAQPRRYYAVWGVLSAFTLFCTVLTIKQIETWQDSIALWSRVVEQHPGDAYGYINRGNSYGKERNDIGRAAADFEKAVQLDPNDSFGYAGLGMIAGVQGNHARAFEMFDKSVQLDPGYFNHYYNRGLAYLQLRQAEKAVPDFEKALQLNSGNYDRFMPSYLEALLLSGNFALAKTKSDEALQRGLRTAGVYLARAQALLNLGDAPAARADAQQALALEPNNIIAKRLANI
jgi:protein O-mannosyl-transferase